MAGNFNTNTANNDEWLTPPELVKSLGNFDLDPCRPGSRRPWDTATTHYGLPDDGLAMPWLGRVWCNPPYGRLTFNWLSRLAAHGSGTALVFARTETKGFHSEVWGKAHSVFFFKGRIKFHRVSGERGDVANAPSCLVSYSPHDTLAIQRSGLIGKLIVLIGNEL